MILAPPLQPQSAVEDDSPTSRIGVNFDLVSLRTVLDLGESFCPTGGLVFPFSRSGLFWHWR